MREVLDTFKREWPVIAGAPWSFGACVAVSAAAIWLALQWFNRRTLDGKNAEIAAKGGVIDLLKQELEQCKAKLPAIGPPQPPMPEAVAPPRPAPDVETAAAGSPTAVPAQQALYVGRVDVDTNRLEGDFLLEFAFIAFNGAPAPLRLAGLRGRIAYSKSVVAPEADWATLPTPAIRDDNPTAFAPFSEFLVMVSQGVPGALAAEIGRGLAAGERVVFVLEGLDVLLAAERDADGARLPVWERVTCERLGVRTIVGRVVFWSAASHLGASDGR